MADDPAVVPFEEPPPELPRPAAFAKAPAWGYELYEQHRRDRHNTARQLAWMQAEVKALSDKLGAEPNTDGTGGKGLIGDVRKLGRDVGQLMELKAKGLGFVAAVVLFGALIIAGIIHFGQQYFGTAKP